MGKLPSFAKRIDLHTHTDFSDGQCSIDDVMKIAGTKGLSVVAITDHYCEFLDLPRRMAKRHLADYLSALNGFNLLKGVEVEILDDGTVSISRTMLPLFDVVIGGLHVVRNIRFWGDHTPIFDKSRYVEQVRTVLLKALESKKLDVITHVTRLPETLLNECSTLLTDDWVKSVVTAAGENDVAVEINGAWRIPDAEFIAECLRQGVKLSLGSDAHTAWMVGETRYGTELLKQFKIEEESVFLPKKVVERYEGKN